MTIANIAAIISLLLAFGVDPKVAANVQAILTPVSASTTPISVVPVVQTPVAPNQPVYFGSVAPVQNNPIPTPPVDNTPVVQTPVIQSAPVQPLLWNQFQVGQDVDGSITNLGICAGQAGCNVLVLTTSKQLNMDATIVPSGVSISNWTETKKGMQKFGKSQQLLQAWQYTAILSGANGPLNITIQDLDGQTGTMQVAAND